MTMEINDLIMLIGAMGGLEGAKWIVRSIRHWQSDRRKEDAAADSLVDENHRRRIDWMEKRVEEKDKKIDALYDELRQEQSRSLKLLSDCHKCELEAMRGKMMRCEMPGCADRRPASGY